MRCNTSESIIMSRNTLQPKHAIVLRTILSTGVLAGAAVGTTWVLDDAMMTAAA
jgi:hypothetical protein